VKKKIGRQADHFNIPQDLVFEDFDLANPTGVTSPAGGAGGGITYQDYLNSRKPKGGG
jgi:hypothetical protein